MSVYTPAKQSAKQHPPQLRTFLQDIALQVEHIPIVDDKIRFLLHYSAKVVRSAPRKAKAAAAAGLFYAEKLGSRDTVCECHLAIADACQHSGEYSEGLKASYDALKVAEQTQNEQQGARANYQLGVNYTLIANHKMALQKLNLALDVQMKYGNFSDVRSLYHAFGNSFEHLGNYPKALEYHRKGLEVSEYLEDNYSIAIGLNHIGNVHLFLENYPDALECYRRSLSIRIDIDDIFGEAETRSNLAVVLSKSYEFRQALEHLFAALEIFERVDNLPMIVQTYSTIGATYLANREYDVALRYLRDALALTESMSKTNIMQSVQLHIAQAYYQTSHFHRALEFTHQALTRAAEREDKKTMYKAHLLSSTIWEELGNIEKAYHHHKEFTRIKDDFHGVEKQKLVAEMQVRYEVEKAEKEREIYRLKAEQLELDVNKKDRELTVLALHVAQKNEFIDKMHQKMNTAGMNAHASDTKEQINKFAAEMRSNVHVESQWTMFQQKFTQLHPEFMRTLSKMHNSLTPTELKICALLKINLSNKEIATMLSVSTHNIEMHRYRIRKKFGLSTQTNLSSFLAPL